MPKHGQRGPDIAPEIRRHFVRALKHLEAEKKPLYEIIKKELEKNPVATLKAMAAFLPRHVVHSGDSENPIEIQVVRYSELTKQTQVELAHEAVKQLDSIDAEIVPNNALEKIDVTKEYG